MRPIPAMERDNPSFRDTYRELKATNAAISALQHLVEDFTEEMMPQWIALTATNFCNLRCPHCQTHGTEDARKTFNVRVWGQDLVTRLVSEALPTAQEFCLSLSGEPLATPYLRRRLQEAAWYGAKLHLTTNGTLLSKETLIRVLPVARTISLSIDGATRRVCEEIRLGANFPRLITNIRTLTRAVELLPDEYSPDVHLAFTVMTSNVREMPHMVHLARTLGVSVVDFYEVNIYYEHLRDEDLKLVKPLYNAYHRRTKEEAARLGVDVTLPPLFPDVGAELDLRFDGGRMIVRDLPDDYYETLPDPATYLDLGAIEEAAVEVASMIMRRDTGGEPPEAAPAAGTEDVKAALAKARSVYETLLLRHADKIESLRSRPEEKVPYCDYIYERTFVNHDGSVAPCCIPGRPTLGNVKDGTIREIYNGGSYTDFRKRFYSDDPPQVCKGCRYSTTISRRPLLETIDRVNPGPTAVRRARRPDRPLQPVDHPLAELGGGVD